MKKILGTVLIILLIVLAYFAIFEGISIGKDIHILSVDQIIQENDTLTNKIAETSSLIKKDYASKKEIDLSGAVESLLNEKKKYFNLAKISTTGELAQAAREDVYTNDYLWTKTGRYATSRGVIMEMVIKSANVGNENISNIDFTIKGQCPAIADFLYAIEGDSDLNFRVTGFKLVPDATNSHLVATFSVNNVRVKKENVSASVSTSTTDTTGTADTTNGGEPTTQSEGSAS